MDSVRRDVRRGLDKLQVAAVDHGWDRYADPKTLANVREAVEAAIMSALERASGEVVSPLVWRERSGPAWVAATPFGQYAIGKLVAGGFTAQCSGSHFVGDFDTLEAAKAACQADFAKRITSAVEPSEELGKILNPDRETAPKTAPVELGAVEPSCVVTDEMVEAAWSAFVGAGEDWRDGAVRRRDDLDKAALKAALTAALSSRTEEERKEPTND